MSKELTDDYKSKKLKKGWYWVKFNCYANIHPSFYEKGYFWDDGKVEDVISPCDYEVLAHLEAKNEWQAERIKELEQDVKTLTNNYKLLEKQQAENLAHGQALVDEFGDYEAVYQEITLLRNENRRLHQILKESYSLLEKDFQKETMAENFARNRWQKSLKILDEIDEVLK